MTTPTDPESGEVLALLCDRDAAARLAGAVRGGVTGVVGTGAELRRVERVGELRAALADRRFPIVVVEPRDADGAPTDEIVRTIRARWPAIVVIGYARLRAGVATSVLAFARAGVHELVVGGIDDVGHALRAALDKAVQRSGADLLLDEVTALVPPGLVPMVRYCFEHGGDACDVPSMARALGVTRQALFLRTRAAGMPSPRELATWCRLLLAARMLAEGHGTVDEVALEVDFPSANGLRNVLRRYADASIQDVRQYGVGRVLDAFRAALAGAPGARLVAREAAQPV